MEELEALTPSQCSWHVCQRTRDEGSCPSTGQRAREWEVRPREKGCKGQIYLGPERGGIWVPHTGPTFPSRGQESDSGLHMDVETKSAHTRHGELSPSPAQLLWGLGSITGTLSAPRQICASHEWEKLKRAVPGSQEKVFTLAMLVHTCNGRLVSSRRT